MSVVVVVSNIILYCVWITDLKLHYVLAVSHELNDCGDTLSCYRVERRDPRSRSSKV